MITELTEELRLDDGSRRISRDPALPGKLLIEAARHYTFHLCRKNAVMGDVAIDQWWMKRSTLYGGRGQTAVNYRVIVKYWWSLCMKDLSAFEDSIQENFILASLLPLARSNGCRRVFGDAVPARNKSPDTRRSVVIAQLDELLAASRQEELGIVEFRDQTANCLGPPEYDPEIQRVYDDFTGELFGEGRRALEHYGEKGLIVAEKKWGQWLKSIARRSGHQAEKEVLDILSYECRAAFHQCYSAVWCDLLPYLAEKYQMSDESYSFHWLWHFDRRLPSDRPEDAYFHLFHGHVFALHSAAGDFISTRTGSEMLGDWLNEGGDGAAFRRLLHGLLVAMHYYALRNNIYAELRKTSPSFFAGQDLVGLEERLTERRSRRRRRHRPRD